MVSVSPVENGEKGDKDGAIIRPETELVSSGAAHIGVLFIHNERFSTMCGNATIALRRFLVDTTTTLYSLAARTSSSRQTRRPSN